MFRRRGGAGRPRSLLRRNVALMVAVVLAGQILAGLFVVLFVMGPQIERVAAVSADMVLGISQGMEGLPVDRQRAVLARFERGGEIEIRTHLSGAAPRARFPSYIERRFIRAMNARLAPDQNLDWRKGEGNRLWFRLRLGANSYWVSATPPSQRSALASLVYALASAFVVAVAAGLYLQRRLDAPLRRLAAEVEAYDPQRESAAVAVAGPREVAAVAGAFNRMAERLRGEEAERSLMLAGVSHDLRTPLTRLRLCLEMMQGADAELEASAERQVDRIEAMLEQFLDFARGFQNEAVRSCDLGLLLVMILRDTDPENQVRAFLPEGVELPLRTLAVSRAVGNLLGNALRHGTAPITLELRATPREAIVVVGDAGEGFDAARAEELTRPFARGDSARSGDGAGLGLAIAERVALAQGGRLEFAQGGFGFEARIVLPRSAAG